MSHLYIHYQTCLNYTCIARPVSAKHYCQTRLSYTYVARHVLIIHITYIYCQTGLNYMIIARHVSNIQLLPVFLPRHVELIHILPDISEVHMYCLHILPDKSKTSHLLSDMSNHKHIVRHALTVHVLLDMSCLYVTNIPRHV